MTESILIQKNQKIMLSVLQTKVVTAGKPDIFFKGYFLYVRVFSLNNGKRIVRRGVINDNNLKLFFGERLV